MSRNHSKSPNKDSSSKNSIASFTRIRNFLLDGVMPLVSQKYPKYFQVLLFIERKTTGWGKAGDFISLTQLQRGSGASRDTVIDALSFWKEVGLIIRGQRLGYRGTIYFEVAQDFDEPEMTSRITRLVESADWSNDSASTSRTIPPPLVEPVDTQKKVFKRNYKGKESGSASPHRKSPPKPDGRSDKSDYHVSEDIYE